MSNFAEINEDNIVIRVLVVDDLLPNKGKDWLVENLGGKWIETSPSGEIRKNFAGAGFSYDPELDAFIGLKPFESWTLDENTCTWEAPKAYPTDGKDYQWKEQITSWVEIPQENTGQ